MTAIYLAIKLYIQQKFPDVLHIDLWNEQILNIEDEVPFSRPAIFVEFGDILWNNVSKASKTGTVPTTLHIVTDCYDVRADDADSLSALDRLDQTSEKFDNLKIPKCTPFMPTSTAIDNNHGNLIHNTLSYTFDLKLHIRGGENLLEVEPNLKVTGTFLQNG